MRFIVYVFMCLCLVGCNNAVEADGQGKRKRKNYSEMEHKYVVRCYIDINGKTNIITYYANYVNQSNSGIIRFKEVRTDKFIQITLPCITVPPELEDTLPTY